jgi:carbonic anhydrase
VIDAAEAFERLRAGNQRFVDGLRDPAAAPLHQRRLELTTGQNPFAIVLGCSDSRVPAELVFDQGLGDLFVIRVAGNIVAPSQIGSVEFAAARFQTRLCVVLGHSRCGALDATLDELEHPGASGSRNLRSIVDRIRPAVAHLGVPGSGVSREEWLSRAIRANVEYSTRQLRRGSEILEQLIRHEGLSIVGAEYSLDSGRVEFLGSPISASA